MAYDEARSDLFTDQVGRFRRWMAARGYRDLPFYMTEVGVLMPPSLGYSPEVVSRFIRAAFDYMLAAQDAQLGYPRDGNRLVQRFAWYATLTPNANGALFESLNSSTPISPPFGLGPIGLAYQGYRATSPPPSRSPSSRLTWRRPIRWPAARPRGSSPPRWRSRSPARATWRRRLTSASRSTTARRTAASCWRRPKAWRLEAAARRRTWISAGRRSRRAPTRDS